MGDASIKGRSPLLKGGRVGLRRGGPLPYLSRGWSRPGVYKAPRGKQHMAEILKQQTQASKTVKGTKIRKEYADLKRAHRTKEKILKARAGRKEAAHQKAVGPKYGPYGKELASRAQHPKSWRRAGKS